MFESKPLEFVKGTFRNPAAVGSIFPSSKFVARAYLRGLDLGGETRVLEWGPGTGPVTELIYERMEDPSRYLGIEQDEGYVEVLEDRFPEMHFCQGSAEDSTAHLREVGLEGADVIISALPFTTLPEPVRDRIYEELDALMTPGTVFRAIILATAYPTENSRRFRRRMNRLFGPFDRSSLVWRNLPPAFILSWEV